MPQRRSLYCSLAAAQQTRKVAAALPKPGPSCHTASRQLTRDDGSECLARKSQPSVDNRNRVKACIAFRTRRHGRSVVALPGVGLGYATSHCSCSRPRRLQHKGSEAESGSFALALKNLCSPLFHLCKSALNNHDRCPGHTPRFRLPACLCAQRGGGAFENRPPTRLELVFADHVTRWRQALRMRDGRRQRVDTCTWRPGARGRARSIDLPQVSPRPPALPMPYTMNSARRLKSIAPMMPSAALRAVPRRRTGRTAEYVRSESIATRPRVCSTRPS